MPSAAKIPLKICIASQAPFVGGAEVAMERLALGLHRMGHDVVFALGSDNEVGSRLSQAGLRWFYLPMPYTSKSLLLSYCLAFIKFIRFLRKEKVNILHCNDLPSFQFPGNVASLLGIKKICHHRFVYEREGISWFLKPGADCHVYVSDFLKKELESIYPPLNKNMGAVNYDGLDLPPKIDWEQKQLIRKSLDLPDDKVVVLYAGQIIPRKGVQDLLVAWTFLEDSIKNIACLVIIGDDSLNSGAYKKEMEIYANKLRVDADFRGFQANVPDWLNAADIVMVPSHLEPLGNAVLEAMSHGKPVIGGAVGGILEMIDDPETGYLVTPKSPELMANKISILIEDEQQRLQMGEKARLRCQKIFSLDEHARRMSLLYDKLINK